MLLPCSHRCPVLALDLALLGEPKKLPGVTWITGGGPKTLQWEEGGHYPLGVTLGEVPKSVWWDEAARGFLIDDVSRSMHSNSRVRVLTLVSLSPSCCPHPDPGVPSPTAVSPQAHSHHSVPILVSLSP